jgi:hypothetical protein
MGFAGVTREIAGGEQATEGTRGQESKDASLQEETCAFLQIFLSRRKIKAQR